jgi:hypothetical protein
MKFLINKLPWVEKISREDGEFSYPYRINDNGKDKGDDQGWQIEF